MFEFIAEAKEVTNTPWAEVGAWTDGIGIFSDNDQLCAFRLEIGKTYKVTIEEVKK